MRWTDRESALGKRERGDDAVCLVYPGVLVDLDELRLHKIILNFAVGVDTGLRSSKIPSNKSNKKENKSDKNMV